jgi:hypothetical protein
MSVYGQTIGVNGILQLDPYQTSIGEKLSSTHLNMPNTQII